MIAALYVSPFGPYANRADVDAWTVARDARIYTGPYPVVAHPPCERWGRYATRGGQRVGDDGGCFGSALRAVMFWGGVLEHPACSKAFAAYGIPRPEARGWTRYGADVVGWTRYPVWVCSVEQGHYGHRARKATWLLYCGNATPPDLIWGPSQAKILPREGRDPARERRRGAIERMCRAERERTPAAFAELLIQMARGAR